MYTHRQVVTCQAIETRRKNTVYTLANQLVNREATNPLQTRVHTCNKVVSTGGYGSYDIDIARCSCSKASGTAVNLRALVERTVPVGDRRSYRQSRKASRYFGAVYASSPCSLAVKRTGIRLAYRFCFVPSSVTFLLTGKIEFGRVPDHNAQGKRKYTNCVFNLLDKSTLCDQVPLWRRQIEAEPAAVGESLRLTAAERPKLLVDTSHEVMRRLKFMAKYLKVL